jgi:DNA sulfur modification protein DndE
VSAPFRIVLSETTTSVLRSLTSKTGLSANVLARFAMLISFEDDDQPAVDAGKPGLTINRTTLFGELEPFLMTAFALKNRTGNDQNIGKEIGNHIARGSSFMNVRIHSLTDLLALVHDIS